MAIAIIVALLFDVMNGFHDTANAVATVIYTKALPPQVAIGMCAIMNMVGPFLLGTAVAKVIATSIIPSEKLTITIVVAGLMGAIIWDLITWYYGLPVSSSHALIGGLVGSGLAAIGISGVKWGGLTNIVLALFISPVAGIVLGLVFMYLIGRFIFSRMGREQANSVFKKIQILSSAAVSLTHGSNDAQKTMGIIAMFVAVTYGTGTPVIEPWIIVACAAAIGLGDDVRRVADHPDAGRAHRQGRAFSVPGLCRRDRHGADHRDGLAHRCPHQHDARHLLEHRRHGHGRRHGRFE